MKITKLGHCCMLIETTGLRIITDPGGWSDFRQNELFDIDLVFITHEHGDHLHIDSLKTIISNNPKIKIITNNAVKKIVANAGIDAEILEDGQSNTFEGLKIQGYGEHHHEIYNSFGMVQNTGYFFDDKFFYPGDAFTIINKPVEVLALPVVGPWLTIKSAINYAKEVKPKLVFPVHDGMLRFNGPFHKIPYTLLSEEKINFICAKEDNDRTLEIVV